MYSTVRFCITLFCQDILPKVDDVQVIGVVVADTEQHARMAAQRVKIEYEDLPSLISCEDAIKANSFYEVWTSAPSCCSAHDCS